MKRLLFLMGIVAVLFLSACSGEDNYSPPGDRFQLVSEDEGTPNMRGTMVYEDIETGCQYYTSYDEEYMEPVLDTDGKIYCRPTE
jgi:Family of unknown function (DUF6440)